MWSSGLKAVAAKKLTEQNGGEQRKAIVHHMYILIEYKFAIDQSSKFFYALKLAVRQYPSTNSIF